MFRGLAIIALSIGMACVSAAPPPRATQATPPVANLPAIEAKSNGVINRFGCTRFRYPGRIWTLVLSPDGTRLAARGRYGFWVFDVATGEVIWKEPEMQEANTIQYGSPVFLNADTVAIIYEVDRKFSFIYRYCIVTNRIVSKTNVRLNLKKSYNFGTDGLLVYMAEGTQLVIFDANTGAMIRRIQTPATKSISDVTFSPNGQTLFLRIDDSQIVFYDRVLGREIARTEQNSEIKRASFSADGSKVVGIANYDYLVIVDVRTGKRTGKIHTSGKMFLSHFHLTSQNEIVACENRKSRIRVAESSTSKQLPSFLSDFEPEQFIVSHDEKTVFVASREGGIVLYDFATRQKQPQSADTTLELASQSGFYPRLRYSDDHRLTSIGNPTFVWNTASGKSLTLSVSKENWHDLSSDGTQFLSVNKRVVSEWNIATGLLSKQYDSQQKSDLSTVDYSDDGTAIVGYSETNVFSWNRETNRVAMRSVSDRKDWKDRQFSGDGTRFASVVAIPSTENQYELSCVELKPDGKKWRVQYEAKHAPYIHKFSRTGNRMFVEYDAPIDEDNSQRFVDCYCPITGRRLHRIGCEGWSQYCFAPDGRCFAVLHQDKVCKIIEVATGRERSAFDLLDGFTMFDAAYSPDSQRLATRMVSGKIYIWDVYYNQEALREFNRDSLEKAWCDLGSIDAKVGFRAICHLAKFPAKSLPFLIEKLPPERMSADAISLWLEQLDARDYTLRERAYRQLVPYVGIIVPQLESMRKTTDSGQVREQIERLLDVKGAMTTERLRAIRAIETIERIAIDSTAGAAANAQAKAALSRMASGETGMTLTQEATSAIARLR